MNPLILDDCQKVLPNPFLLAIAAAARARALRHGAEPKVSCGTPPPIELALQEIAAGLLAEGEFELQSSPNRSLLAHWAASSAGKTERDRSGASAAAAPALH